MSWIMIIQLLIVLGALWVGSRYGSLALVYDAGPHLRDRLDDCRLSPDPANILTV